MELLLLDMSEDQPKKLGTFTLTQKEIDDDLVYVVEKRVAELLNVKWEHVFVVGQGESLTPMELFVSNGHSFSILVNKVKYSVIPT